MYVEQKSSILHTLKTFYFHCINELDKSGRYPRTLDYITTYSWGIKGFNKPLFYGVKLP